MGMTTFETFVTEESKCKCMDKFALSNADKYLLNKN